MTKEQFIEIRNAEKELQDCQETIRKMNDFFDNYEDFIKSFNDPKTIEALKKIKRYEELLSYKSLLLNNKLVKIRTKYKKICNHEIAMCISACIGLKKKDIAYKCQICGNILRYKELTEETIIIDSEFLYYDEYIRKAIDYIMENNLKFTEKTLSDVRRIIIPNSKYTVEDLKEKKMIWRKK